MNQPVDTIEQLTTEQRMNAYAVVKERYNLKHRERTFLDTSDLYGRILVRAHNEAWENLDILMRMLLADFAMAQSFELAASEPVGALDYLDLQ